MSKFAIMIPTIGVPDILVPTVYSIISNSPTSTGIYISIDKTTDTDIEGCKAQLGPVLEKYDINFTINKRKNGFASNSNNALSLAMRLNKKSKISMYVMCNDDVRVTPGWLEGLYKALNTPAIFLQSSPKPVPIEKYGKMGIVGPVSDTVIGIQRIELPPAQGIDKNELFKIDGGEILRSFAENHRLHSAGQVMSCDFLSGFCMAISPECMEDMCGRSNKRRPILFDEYFGKGGFEDNDLCLRAIHGGWKLGIAQDTFIHHIGHQTLDRYPEMKRGSANYDKFIQKWQKKTPKDNTIIGCYRMRFSSFFEFSVAKESLKRTAQSTDGIAVLMTANPYDLSKERGWDNFFASLSPNDKKLFLSCDGSSNEQIQNALFSWLFDMLKPIREQREFLLKVEVWDGEWNERDERNRAIEIAESIHATWIISVDADEVLEDRATYQMMHKLASHPNPHVMKYDFVWLNHWDSERLCRYDAPWGDDGTYTGHMRGFRMWRVLPHSPRRIIAGNDIGLHCGNCPEYGTYGARFANIRFRHLGMLHSSERQRKYEFYTSIDKNPDKYMVGNDSYDHLISEENVRTYAFNRFTGIGLSMMAYEREEPVQIWEKVDQLYSMTDEMVFTWTSTESLPAWAENLSEQYGVTWVHKEFSDSLSDCRNESINQIDVGARERFIGWVLVLDPDEFPADWTQFLFSLRRQVEASDTFGWIFPFNNLLNGQDKNSYSEVVRLFRLHTHPQIRYSGKIHETVDDSLAAIRATGTKAYCRSSKSQMVNLGLTLDKEDMQRKIELYTRKLIEGINENPKRDGYWVCLGLQYGNDGNKALQEECYKRAVSLNPIGFLSYKEYALFHLRESKVLLQKVLEKTPHHHPHHIHTSQILNFLNEAIQDQTILDTIPLEIPIPDFEYPDDQDKF